MSSEYVCEFCGGAGVTVEAVDHVADCAWREAWDALVTLLDVARGQRETQTVGVAIAALNVLGPQHETGASHGRM